MAKRRFEMVQDVVPNWVTNGQADWSGARPLNPSFTNPACDEEWRFEYGRRSLVGVKKRGLMWYSTAYVNTILQPPGFAGLDVYPSYTPNSVIISPRAHCGLTLPYAQASSETLYVLMQIPAVTSTASYRFIGNTTLTTSDGGWELNLPFNSSTGTFSGITAITRGVTPNRSYPLPAAAVAAQALFIGVSHSPTGRAVYIGGVSYGFDAGSPVVGASTRPHAIGEIYNAGNTNASYVFYALCHASTAFLQPDFDVAYAISKQLAASRGITVY